MAEKRAGGAPLRIEILQAGSKKWRHRGMRGRAMMSGMARWHNMSRNRRWHNIFLLNLLARKIVLWSSTGSTVRKCG